MRQNDKNVKYAPLQAVTQHMDISWCKCNFSIQLQFLIMAKIFWMQIEIDFQSKDFTFGMYLDYSLLVVSSLARLSLQVVTT